MATLQETQGIEQLINPWPDSNIGKPSFRDQSYTAAEFRDFFQA